MGSSHFGAALFPRWLVSVPARSSRLLADRPDVGRMRKSSPSARSRSVTQSLERQPRNARQGESEVTPMELCVLTPASVSRIRSGSPLFALASLSFVARMVLATTNTEVPTISTQIKRILRQSVRSPWIVAAMTAYRMAPVAISPWMLESSHLNQCQRERTSLPTPFSSVEVSFPFSSIEPLLRGDSICVSEKNKIARGYLVRPQGERRFE